MPEKITIDLSPFEKLQILRDELELRQKELTDTEASIVTKLSEIERQRYLEGMSPYYSANRAEGIPTREEIDALEVKRAQLVELIASFEATIPTLLGSSAQEQAPSEAGGPARRAKFDSFDDFAAAKKKS